MTLIRKLLEHVEAYGNGGLMDAPEICGHDTKEVHYHIELIGQAGYVNFKKCSGAEEIHQRFAIGEMTWRGHEALESMRHA